MNNRGRFISPKAAPGFVYFNTSTTNKADTSDFLAFSDNAPSPQQQHRLTSPRPFSPHVNKFSPGYSSSPVQFRRGSPGNYHTNRQYNQSGNQYHSSGSNFNSSSFNNSMSDGSSFYSNANRSRNESWNSSSCSYNNRRGKKRNSDGEETRDISNFIHPSFFEDPWAHLVKQVKDKWQKEEIEASKCAEKKQDETIESETNESDKDDTEGSSTEGSSSGDESSSGDAET